MGKKITILGVFAVLFFIGIVLILKSDAWGWGDFISMNLAGAIMSIFAGTGFLFELYSNKNH